MNTSELDLKDVASCRQAVVGFARQFAELAAAKENLRTQSDNVIPIVRALSTGVFRIVVMGEVKKGKSSFINALLERPGLLPTNRDVATSTVFKILYGSKEKFTVFFVAPDGTPATDVQPLEITKGELSAYGTEAGNPNNQKNVDFIAIELPNPLLKEGVVIVDTPGVGGLFRGHRDITFRYAPQADAVLFVVDSVEALISQDEVQFLSELRKTTSNITFLQTKTDQASQEQVEAWRKRNLEIVRPLFGNGANQPAYFVVSSKLKESADETHSLDDFVDSGFGAVVHHLRNTLVSKRDELLLERWLPVLLGEVMSGGRLLSDEIAAIQQANKPILVEYEASLRKVIEDFDQWQNDLWPRRLRDFQDDTARLKRNTRNELQDALLAEHSVPQFMAIAKERCKSPEQVEACSEELRSDHAAYCNAKVNEIISQFKQRFAVSFEHTLGQTAQDLDELSSPFVRISKADSREIDSSVIHALREASMTANALQGYVSKATWLAGSVGVTLVSIGWIVPTVGMGIVAASGLSYVASQIWFHIKGYRMGERQLSNALSTLQASLTQTTHVAIRAASRALEEFIAELDIKSRDGFETFRRQFRSQFESRRRDLAALKLQTESERNKSIESASTLLKQLTDIAKRLQEIALQVAQRNSCVQ